MNDLAAQTIQVVNKSDDLVASAIQTANKSIAVYCRYIRSNDVGTTGSHQSGFYIQKHFSDDLFDVVCQKGTNKTISIKINWQDGSVTNSNFKYYGQGTRNEARITGFGKNFEFLSDKYSGSLLVLCRACYKDLLFHAFVLSSDEDIEIFIAETNILPGSLYLPKKQEVEDNLTKLFSLFPNFPKTEEMAVLARENIALNKTNVSNVLKQWVSKEYELFSIFEKREFEIIKSKITDLDSFINFAHSFTNRRKARAGKSLELHLSRIFDEFSLKLETQAKTEGKKKPDFLFPGSEEYHAMDESGNFIFQTEKLTMLGSKTTCKDRWRQVLNEADRIPHKHLFTLQEGISDTQIQEMSDENLTLVVPKESVKTFGTFGKTHVLTLENFIKYIKSQQVS